MAINARGDRASWKEDGRLAKPGIVATVMSNLGSRLSRRLGIEMVRTPVGDRYVLEQMLSRGYNLAASPPVTYFVGLRHHRRRFCCCTAGTGGGAETSPPVSEVCHLFDPLPQILKNVRYRSGKPLEDAEVKSAIDAGEKRLNGHGRLLVRSSGTEPVIRVMGEAMTASWSRKWSIASSLRSATPRRRKLSHAAAA